MLNTHNNGLVMRMGLELEYVRVSVQIGGRVRML